MGVYIKGINMPKDCTQCLFVSVMGLKCIFRDIHSRESMVSLDKGKRHKDCPLIEVKEPHGKLIDADKEYEELSEMKVEGKTFTIAVEFSKRIVQEAQTVIEAEE